MNPAQQPLGRGDRPDQLPEIDTVMINIPFKAVLFEVGVLIVFAVVSAFIFNALRPQGIEPWGGWRTGREASATITTGHDVTGAVDGAMSREDAKALLNSGQALFVDARAAESFQAGHIPGAVSLPLGRIDDVINGFLTDHGVTTAIVTYCSSVNCPDAERLAALLKDFGYSNVSVFKGGMESWQEGGLPVE